MQDRVSPVHKETKRKSEGGVRRKGKKLDAGKNGRGNGLKVLQKKGG